MTPQLNIRDIEAVHNEVEARLNMITPQDGGRAHRHRLVLLEELKRERRASGVEALMLEIERLKLALHDSAQQLAEARAVIMEQQRDASQLRAELGSARTALASRALEPQEVARPAGKPFPGQLPPAPVGVPPKAVAAPRGASRLPQIAEGFDVEETTDPAPPMEVDRRPDGTPKFKPCWRCDDPMRCARSNHCPNGEAPQIIDDPR